MKMRTLSVLAGVSTPLILTGSASAGFVGLDIVSKENTFGLLVCNVYAVFDNTAGDIMQAVAGLPGQNLVIQVQNGSWFAPAGGTDQAPSTFLVGLFPSLAFDTFVTIGVKQSGTNPQGGGIGVVDQLTLTPTFPGFGTSSLTLTNDSWAVTPVNAQSNPFDPAYAAGDGRVLIFQGSTADGTGIGGEMLLQFVSDGVAGSQAFVSFFHVPSPGAMALLGTAGLIGARRRRRK